MIHLKPVSEKHASENVQEVYISIRANLSVETVPLYFQYLGNFDLFLRYLWDRLSPNLKTHQFTDMHEELMTFSQMTIDVIYTPSAHTAMFVSSLSKEEKTKLLQEAETIQRTSSLLFYLALAVRESIKGVTVPITTQKALASPDGFFSHLVDKEASKQKATYDEHTNDMLVPLFGTHMQPTIQYTEFFTCIDLDMGKLMTSETYLKTRVELEHMGMLYLNAFPYPLGTSYRQVMDLIGKEPYVYELIHLLKDIFPTTFPRLLLTSSVMRKAIVGETRLAAS